MAEYDGRITISTALDNTEFEAGSDELRNAIASASSQLQALSGRSSSLAGIGRAAHEAAASIDSIGESTAQARNSLDGLSGEAADVARALAESSDSLSYEEGLQSVRETAQALKAAAAAGEMFERSSDLLTTDEASDHMNKLAEKVIKLASEIEKTGGSISRAKLSEFRKEAAQLQKELTATGKIKFSSKALEETQLKYGLVLHSLMELQDQMKLLESLGVDANSAEFMQLSAAIDEATSEAQFYRGVLDGLQEEKLDILTAGELEDFNLLSKKLDEIKSKVGGIKWPSNPFSEPVRDVSFTDLLQEKARGTVSSITSAFTGLKDRVLGTFRLLTGGISGMFSGIGAKVIGFVLHPIQSINSALGGFVQRVGQTLSFVGQCALTAAKGLWNITKSGASAALKAIGNAARNICAKGLQALSNAAKSAAKNLAKAAKNSVANGFKKLGSAIKGSGSSAKSAGTGFKGLTKRLLSISMAARAARLVFNFLRSAISEGMKSLAAYSGSFNNTMSQFYSSLMQLKNSLTTAFEPIMNVALPYLTAFMDGLTQACNKVGEFFAVLNGQTTYNAAQKQQVDYAKDIAKTTKETDKNTEATKENQKTLAGFDDVEILKEDKSSETEEEEDPLKDPSKMFETRSVTDGMKNLLEDLKSMWENADFSALGFKLGVKLKDALNSIPWDEIRETASRLGQSFASFLNGVFNVPGLGTAIGETIAQGLNTAFEFLHGFVSTLDWGALGRFIKEGITGFTDSIDWELIFETFRLLGSGLATAVTEALDNVAVWSGIFTTVANGLNALVYGITEFLTAVDWYSLAANIGAGLNTGIEALDWNALATLISEGIMTVAMAIDGFVTTVDWAAIGLHFAESFNQLFNQINWPFIGLTLCDSFNALIDTLYTFITELDFGLIGDSLGTALSVAINGINWFEGGYTVGATISGLFEALMSFIDAIDWGSCGAAIIQLIAGFFAGMDWSTFGGSISSAVIGLLDLLTGAIQEVDWEKLPQDIINEIAEFLSGFDWSGIAESTGKLVGAAFKALVDIGGSLWDAMVDFGKDVIEGGWQGIKEKVSGVGDWLKKNLMDPFIKGFKNAFGIQSPSKEMKPLGGFIIEGMLQGVKDGIGSIANIGSWLKTNVFDNFMNGFKNIFGIHSPSTEMKKQGKYIPAGFEEGIKGGMKDVNSKAADTVAKPYIAAITKAFEITGGKSKKFVEIGKQLITGFKSGISDEVKSIESWVKTNITDLFFAALKRQFGINESTSTTMKTLGEVMIRSFYSAFNTTDMSAIQSWCQSIVNTIQNSFSTTDWNGIGSNITIGLNNGIVSQCQTLYDNAQSIANNVFSIMRSAMDIHSPSRKFRDGIGKQIMLGLAEGIQDYSGQVDSAVSKVAESLIDDASDINAEMPVSFALDDALEGIADRFVTGIDRLVAGLESVVDSVSFKLPAMADGSVIPYAAAGAYGSSRNWGGSSTDYSDMQVTSIAGITLQDLKEQADRLIDALYATQTVVSDSAIYRANQRETDRQTRRFNKK